MKNFSLSNNVRIFSMRAVVTIFLFLIGTSSVYAEDCHRHSVPVHLSPDDSTVYNVVGWLCGDSPLEGRTIQVLLSGGMYGHVYWDFPDQSGRYSYVKKMNKAGYATFNMDRIGIGQSDHPDPGLVTLHANAYITHQIIQALRSGEINGVSFSKVILVGHSLGSFIAVEEASQYADVDGVILTGFIHYDNPTFGPLISTKIYPAFLDPRFSSGLAPGYLTSIPGSRADLFYHLPTSDPTVISLDEETKETATVGELSQVPPVFSSTASRDIHVPVLVALGEFDIVYCGSAVVCDEAGVLANEASFYSPSACLEVEVLDNTGHALNLHTNAKTWYKIARRWADKKVGVSSDKFPSPHCH